MSSLDRNVLNPVSRTRRRAILQQRRNRCQIHEPGPLQISRLDLKCSRFQKIEVFKTPKVYLSKGVERPRERRQESGRRGKADQPIVAVEVSRRVKENQPGDQPGCSGGHPKGQARAKGLGEEGHVPAGPWTVLKNGFESVRRRGLKKGAMLTIRQLYLPWI